MVFKYFDDFLATISPLQTSDRVFREDKSFSDDDQSIQIAIDLILEWPLPESYSSQDTWMALEMSKEETFDLLLSLLKIGRKLKIWAISYYGSFGSANHIDRFVAEDVILSICWGLSVQYEDLNYTDETKWSKYGYSSNF